MCGSCVDMFTDELGCKVVYFELLFLEKEDAAKTGGQNRITSSGNSRSPDLTETREKTHNRQNRNHEYRAVDRRYNFFIFIARRSVKNRSFETGGSFYF